MITTRVRYCPCGGVLDYIYHVIWRCRDCRMIWYVTTPSNPDEVK